MAFVSVGMAEVSTNDIVVQRKDRVKKGDLLGKFHFGGSTHLLIFEKGVNLERLDPQQPSVDAENWPLSAALFRVRPRGVSPPQTIRSAHTTAPVRN